MKYYLALSGIQGSSTSATNKNWIEIDALDFGLLAPPGGKSEFSPLSLNVLNDGALSPLLNALAQGTTLAGATIQGFTEGPSPFLAYEMNLAGLRVTGLGETVERGFNLDLAYESIEINTAVIDAVGKQIGTDSFGWDVASNKAANINGVTPPPGSHAGNAGNFTFLAISGFNGGSKSAGHEGWFEIDPASVSVSALVPGDPISGFGTAEFGKLSLDIDSNSSLAGLLQKITSGESIPSIHIESGDIVGKGFTLGYKLSLGDVLVTGISEREAAASGADGYTLELAYKIIETITTDPVTKAKSEFTYDVSTGKNSGTIPGVALGSSVAQPAEAQTYYLALSGITGDSATVGREGWFEIGSLDFNITANSSFPSGGGAKVGKAVPSLVGLSLKTDSALAQLLAASASSKSFAGATIVGVTGAGDQVYDLSLSDVLIAGISEDINQGLRLDLGYKAFEVETKGFDASNKLVDSGKFGFDFSGGKPVTVAAVAPDLTPDGKAAAVTYLMKIDGLTGDSQTKGFEGWFNIGGFDLDITHPGYLGPGSGTSLGLPEFSNLSVDFKGTAGYVALMQALAGGTTIKGVSIVGLTADATPFQTYELNLDEVKVSSFNSTDIAFDASAGFSANFTFDEIQVKAIDPATKTQSSSGWEISTGKSNPPMESIKAGTLKGSSGAGDEFFFAISGAGGSSTDPAHKGWFDILSYSLGAAAPGGGAGDFGDLQITFDYQPSIAPFLSNLVTGKLFSGATIHGFSTVGGKDVQGTNLDFANLKLVDLVFGASDESRTVTLTFDYQQIEVTTNRLDPLTGAVTDVPEVFGWNTVTNSKTTVGSVLPGKFTGEGAGATFMVIDGLNGGSQNVNYGGWFDIGAMNFSASNIGASAEFGSVTVDLVNNESLTQLLSLAASGKMISGIAFDGVNDFGQKLSTLSLGNVRVSQIDEAETADFNGFQVTFDYEIIKAETFSAAGSSTSSFGWDAAANKSFTGIINPSPGGTARADTLTGSSLNNTIDGKAGNDTIYGLAGNDFLNGGLGSDNLRGGAGADALNGGGGGIDFASYYYDNAVVMSLDGSYAGTGAALGDTFSQLDNISGSNSSGADWLVGNANANRIYGNDGNDRLFGRAGDDFLRGGLGQDQLYGEEGADTFQYTSRFEGGDVISSFSSIDMFSFTRSAFGNLPLGELAASAFQANKSTNFAANSNVRFVLRESDSSLWYDPTGGNGSSSGATDAVLIATITNLLTTMQASDILIV